MSTPFIDLKSQYLELKDDIHARINAVLEHGQYIMGPEVGELETRLSEFSGAKHCITVSSGTDALLISLMALGIGPGDEVITTPFSFIATAEVIVLLGATPVFVDIQPNTCNIDPDKIKERITPRTRAIMPVSLFGQPADMDAINEIAREYGEIPVIEDGAQSFGATYKGKRSCNLSTIGCTSFFPSKPLGCYGDGGAIFTGDDELATKCRQLRIHGQTRRYVHESVGVGGRMDTLQCAIVLAKLESFEKDLEQRQMVADRYHYLLSAANIRADLLARPKCDRTSTYAQYCLLIDERDKVQASLRDAGIPTAVHYPTPICNQPAYKRYTPTGGVPVARDISKQIISIPMHPRLDEKEQALIVHKLS